MSALVKAFVTRMPEMLLSSAALITAMLLRLSAKASRMRLRQNSDTAAMTGTKANMISVSGTEIVQRYTNEPTIMMPLISRFSGPWCASSLTSIRSLVMRDMILPVSCSS